MDSDAGQVNFMQVNKSDEGMYTCTAVNDAGNDSHTAQLVVRGTSIDFLYDLNVWLEVKCHWEWL